VIGNILITACILELRLLLEILLLRISYMLILFLYVIARNVLIIIPIFVNSKLLITFSLLVICMSIFLLYLLHLWCILLIMRRKWNLFSVGFFRILVVTFIILVDLIFIRWTHFQTLILISNILAINYWLLLNYLLL
jgi:hypothetical protein